MDNFKNIELVFENCESIIIPKDRLKLLNLGNISRVEGDPWNRTNVYRTDKILIEITYECITELEYDSDNYDEPLGMFIGNPTSNKVIDRPNILGRVLNSKDITCVDILDDNEDEIKTIYVPWHEDDEYRNRYMETEIMDGYVTISIGK